MNLGATIVSDLLCNKTHWQFIQLQISADGTLKKTFSRPSRWSLCMLTVLFLSQCGLSSSAWLPFRLQVQRHNRQHFLQLSNASWVSYWAFCLTSAKFLLKFSVSRNRCYQCVSLFLHMSQVIRTLSEAGSHGQQSYLMVLCIPSL